MLAGGELAAMVVCDAVLRKLPGSLGKDDSAVEESFSAALEGGPEYPHYTRPAAWRGWEVPEVLLSGHHARDRAMAPAAEPGPGPWRQDVRYHGRPALAPVPVNGVAVFSRHEHRDRQPRAQPAASRPALSGR